MRDYSGDVTVDDILMPVMDRPDFDEGNDAGHAPHPPAHRRPAGGGLGHRK